MHAQHCRPVQARAPAQERLAEAAAHSGAHARALQYYEQHVRAVKGNKLNAMGLPPPRFEDDEVSVLLVRHRQLPWPSGPPAWPTRCPRSWCAARALGAGAQVQAAALRARASSGAPVHRC